MPDLHGILHGIYCGIRVVFTGAKHRDKPVMNQEYADRTGPIVSLMDEGILFIDYKGCHVIDRDAVQHVRAQVSSGFPEIRNISVLMDVRGVSEFQLAPSLFAGEGRSFSVICAAWIVDRNMLHFVERTINSDSIGNPIRHFDDPDDAKSWLLGMNQEDKNRSGS